MEINEDKIVSDLRFARLHTILLINIGLLIIQNVSIYLYFVNVSSEEYFSNYWIDIILYACLAFILGIIYLQTKIREYFISFIGFITWLALTVSWRLQLRTKIIPRDLTDESTDWIFVKDFFLPFTSLLFIGSIFFLIGLIYLIKALHSDMETTYITMIYGLSNLVATLSLFLYCVDPARTLVSYPPFMNILFDNLIVFASLSYIAKVFILPVLGIITYFSIIFSQRDVNLIKYYKVKKQIF